MRWSNLWNVIEGPFPSLLEWKGWRRVILIKNTLDRGFKAPRRERPERKCQAHYSTCFHNVRDNRNGANFIKFSKKVAISRKEKIQQCTWKKKKSLKYARKKKKLLYALWNISTTELLQSTLTQSSRQHRTHVLFWDFLSSGFGGIVFNYKWCTILVVKQRWTAAIQAKTTESLSNHWLMCTQAWEAIRLAALQFSVP